VLGVPSGMVGGVFSGGGDRGVCRRGLLAVGALA
jgi:hypothetical protein